ncbi:MAG: hypothetical protein RRB22_00570 [Gammaproteobacteria bacterium]|nr:hypothetical protein [Gammaproteobacteria bacterium]
MNNAAPKKTCEHPLAQLHLSGLSAPLLCLLVTVSFPGFAADDDYLRSLEAESSNSGNKTTATPAVGSNYLDALSAEAASSSSIVTTDQHDDAYYQALEKMAALIKDKKPSTYKFYEKLSLEDQARIFDDYRAATSTPDQRLSHVQKRVMDLYFKK